jgi:beta-lactamase regulating signal transducer with metallopeptidase domain
MIMHETILAHPLVMALGWALVHFIWQGTLVAVLLASSLRVLGGRSTNARYAAACAAMVLMFVLPPATMAIISHSSPVKIAHERPATIAPWDDSQQLTVGSEPAGALNRAGMAISSTQYWPSTRSTSLTRLLPWIVLLWVSGVVFFSLRLTCAWFCTRRLKHYGVRPVEERWQRTLQRLSGQMRLTRPVRLLESTLVGVPTAIGWLRPLILLPAGALTGLTPQQLEAIIAHELAHIRRHDYLINLLQAVIETLLFYHPAVWWVSRRIRYEREHCCDDLAVAVCGDALSYARALLEMEQLRAASPQLAVAANGGSLMNRMQRLIGVQTQDTNRFTGLLVGIIVMTTVVGVGVGAQILLPYSNLGDASIDRHVVSINKQEAMGPAVGRSKDSSDAERADAGKALGEPRSTRDDREALGLLEQSSDDSSIGELRKPLGEQTASTSEQTVNQQATVESVKALHSSNPAERAAAACSLGKLNAVEAIPALINLLGDDTPIQPIKCWSEGNWSPAKDTFKEASPGEQAAIALASLSQAAVEPLTATMSHANSSVRRNAAWAIGEIRGGSGTDRSAAVEPLIAALRDADTWVRVAAAFSLGELRPGRAIDALIDALNDPQWSVREMVVWALGEMKARRGVESLSALLLEDENERVRRKAAWALGEIRDPLALDSLNAALTDRDSRVRATAKWAMAEIQ